jgi:hypothetical protein
MGREATCLCEWGSEAGQCKILLETNELIVRGPIRRRVLIASLTQVSAQDGHLRFRAGEDAVVLALGVDLAQRWAKKMVAPPPTLAAKLGISSQSNLWVIGDFSDEGLRETIDSAAASESKRPDLILASVKTAADLNHALDLYATIIPAITALPPMWIIYPKGPHKPIGETEIRNTLRRESFMDTKVASVSPVLSALRFIKRT